MNSFTDITVQQLRQVLTDVTNQDLTVAELRRLLFAEADQTAQAVRVLASVTR